MAQINFNDWKQTQVQQAQPTNSKSTNGKPSVGFLTLKNDKDFAIVRFMHDSTDDFDIVAGHRMTVNDKLRMVNCIRSANEPVDRCPLCNAGKKLEYRIYIHLIEYVKDENGHIVALPRIWERSASYINTLTNLMNEYGPLSDNIFKIVRNGEKGSKNTTYDITYGRPEVYREELYPKVKDIFDGYKAVGTIVLDYDYKKLEELTSEETKENSAPTPTPKTNYPNAYNNTQTQTTPTPAPAYVTPPASNYNNETPARPRRFYN